MLGVAMDPSDFGGWTLPTFTVAMVAYLLWKGERQDRQNQAFREATLKAQIEVKHSIEELKEELEDLYDNN